jgi:hypothetical protein
MKANQHICFIPIRSNLRLLKYTFVESFKKFLKTAEASEGTAFSYFLNLKPLPLTAVVTSADSMELVYGTRRFIAAFTRALHFSFS